MLGAGPGQSEKRTSPPWLSDFVPKCARIFIIKDLGFRVLRQAHFQSGYIQSNICK